MTSISLTANVRSSLLALQDTAAQQAITNNHLATGKKVSSALDNPVNFFTAQSLNSRSSQLSNLLDGISNGIQTIQAANKGLTSITSLIQQIQATVTQARQDTSATVTPGTATTATVANTSTTGGKMTFTVGTQSVDIATVSAASATATPTTLNGTVNYAAGGGPSTGAGGFSIKIGSGAATAVTFSATDTATDIANSINTATGKSTATVVGGKLQLSDATGQSITLTDGTGGNVGSLAAIGFASGNTSSTNGTPAGSSTPLSTDQLVAAINSNGLLTGKVTASNVGGKLSLQNSTASSIGVKGFSAGTFDGLAATTSTLAAGTPTLSASRQSLANQFNTLTAQLDKISTDSGYNGVNLLQGDHLKVVFNEKTGTNANSIDVSMKNADNTDFGTLNSYNLGIGQAATSIGGSGTDFSSNSSLDTLSDTLKTALTSIQTQSSALGANLSVVQTRQDFTKGIVDVLTTGASNLTDADMNQEAANSQSLSTRNSLAISALSLANSANQGVLQLLR